MINFDNTEIAFKNKSDKDLKQAYWLFKAVASPTFVKLGKFATNFAINTKLPIKSLIKKTIFKQFCGGEFIDECDQTTQSLYDFSIGTILDYSIEGKTTDEDFEATVNEIIATIEKGKSNESIPFAVFKVTGISRFDTLEKANKGESHLSDKDKFALNEVKERVDRICKKAFEADQPIFIDAEETWIQDTIDRIVHEMMEKYNKSKAIVFNTLQMYRHDRLVFLKNMIQEAKVKNYFYGVKLVRGAYMEKERERAKQKNYPSPIQPNKAATDNDFNNALALIIKNIDVVSLCAGTHNEDSSLFLTQLMKKSNVELEDNHVYFAQLLGMSDHISYNLSDAGYNVAKYVPYGPVNEVLPYLLRRAEENTSVAGQTSRKLDLITKELNRIKKLNK